MKKALLLIVILTISVISTACINNLAVQELNAKAKTYMDNGDYDGAIARLKSSIDLDGTVFETYYNLAVAYTKAEDYANAIDAYEHAIKLNPDFADAYYSMAVCEENLAKDLISGVVTVDADGKYVKATQDEINKSQGNNASLKPGTNKYIYDLFTKSIENYQKYVSSAKDEATAKSIQNKITDLKLLSIKYEIKE